MKNRSNTRPIGEIAQTIYKIFVVSVPRGKDDYVRCCTYPHTCFTGTVFYSPTDGDSYIAHEMELEAVREAIIPFESTDSKRIVVYAYYPVRSSNQDIENCRRANERLRIRLNSMTSYEFYNKKW
jgi:hypothetical protein